MKTFRIVFITLCVVLSFNSVALFANAYEYPKEPLSCTSIMVGRKASADGSVITSHTCDGNYRTWMNIVPARRFERDTVTYIYKNRLHTESVHGSYTLSLKGSIPEAKATYRFLDTAYPCLNEKQLGIGETTISGRDTLINPNGLFYIEELEKIVLQRCSTARDAIKLIGELVKEYGYCDGGECLTIADPNEVWHFEIFGEGPDKIGGVWAAVRIPDDHVGVSANISRISTLDLKDTLNYLASDNVYDVAKRLGLWDGSSKFRFWEAYSGGNYFNEKKAFHIREYFILNELAPSLGLSYDSEELPLSVKPDSKVSVERVMLLLAQTYEGSEFDVIKNLKIDSVTAKAANPWMLRDTRNMLNALKPGTVPNNRLVAVPQCAYSTVIQLRSWLPDDLGGVAWISVDNPGQSPRIPIFCGTLSLPECFYYCGQMREDSKSILWKFRKANKLSTVRWGDAKNDILGAMNYFIKKGRVESRYVEERYLEILATEGSEAACAFLTGYTRDFAGAAILRWEELEDLFWKKYGRGF